MRLEEERGSWDKEYEMGCTGVHNMMIMQHLSNFVSRCPELKLIIRVLVPSLYKYKNAVNYVSCCFIPRNQLHFMHCMFRSDVCIVCITFNFYTWLYVDITHNTSVNSWACFAVNTLNMDNVAGGLVEWLTLVLCIQEILDLIFSQEASYSDWSFSFFHLEKFWAIILNLENVCIA
jgi:hypothetical protein